MIIPDARKHRVRPGRFPTPFHVAEREREILSLLPLCFVNVYVARWWEMEFVVSQREVLTVEIKL